MKLLTLKFEIFSPKLNTQLSDALTMFGTLCVE